jgi:hypothetical protein
MVVLTNEPFETRRSDAVLEGRAISEDGNDSPDLSGVGAYAVVVAPREKDDATLRDEVKKPFEGSIVLERPGSARDAKMLPDPPGSLLIGETSLDLPIGALRFEFRERYQLG